MEAKALSGARQSLLSDRGWTITLAVFSAAALIFLIRNHGFIPMWIEGMTEYEAVILNMLGVVETAPACWPKVNGVSIPMALTPYIGPAFFYFYLPFVYLWVNQITSDPYVYRYAGIIVFLADTWIFYYLLRHFFSKAVSFYAAIAFLTMPVSLLLCLTEWHVIFFMQLFILLAALFLINYLKKKRLKYLLLFGLFAGLTLTTRIEGLVWPMAAALIYLILVRPKAAIEYWRETENKLGKIALTLGMVCLGAWPVVIHNLICREHTIFGFLRTTILPRSLDTTSTPLVVKLLTRFYQFGEHNLLSLWPMYELRTPNVAFGAFWGGCAVAVIVMSVAQRKPNFWLVFIVVCLFLSVLTTGGLRYEHLSSLQPLAMVVFASGLTYLSRRKSIARALYFVLPVVILANVVTSALDWRNWNQQPPTAQTMLNQSDPVLLTQRLLQEHANDRVVYTNIGFPQYIQYMTVDRIKGDDITNWHSVEDFTSALKAVLMDGSRRRVLVAASPQRDGLEGTLPRTKRMYRTLDEMGVPYAVKPLSNERNQFLYDLVVIEQGVVPKAGISITDNIRIDEIIDVRTKDGLLRGSVIGSNFEQGDMVVFDDAITFPTAFGNKNWITFSVPRSGIGKSQELKARVFRPSTNEKSEPRSFNVKD